MSPPFRSPSCPLLSRSSSCRASTAWPVVDSAVTRTPYIWTACCDGGRRGARPPRRISAAAGRQGRELELCAFRSRSAPQWHRNADDGAVSSRIRHPFPTPSVATPPGQWWVLVPVEAQIPRRRTPESKACAARRERRRARERAAVAEASSPHKSRVFARSEPVADHGGEGHVAPLSQERDGAAARHGGV